MLIDELQRLERLAVAQWPELASELNPPATDGQIDALRAALAPMVLPRDVETLYRWHDGESKGMFTPWLQLPIEAVIEWRAWRTAPPLSEPPVLLCLFTDGGGDSLLVETATTEDAVPGIVWQQPHADDPVREFVTLADLARTACETLEAGLVERNEYGGLVVRDWRAAEDLRIRLNPETFSSRNPDGAYTVPRAPDPAWPESWLASVGIKPFDSSPGRSTTTISELIAAADESEASGTVVGTVRALGFSSGPDGGWYSVKVRDDTGVLTVQLPEGAAPFAPRIGRQGEVDVTVVSRTEAERRDQVLAGEHAEILRRLLDAENRSAYGSRFRLLPKVE